MPRCGQNESRERRGNGSYFRPTGWRGGVGGEGRGHGGGQRNGQRNCGRGRGRAGSGGSEGEFCGGRGRGGCGRGQRRRCGGGRRCRHRSELQRQLRRGPCRRFVCGAWAGRGCGLRGAGRVGFRGGWGCRGTGPRRQRPGLGGRARPCGGAQLAQQGAQSFPRHFHVEHSRQFRAQAPPKVAHALRPQQRPAMAHVTFQRRGKLAPPPAAVQHAGQPVPIPRA